MANVRAAQRNDIPNLAKALALAFQDDPVMGWMFPDDTMRSARLPRLFAALARYQYLANAEVATADDGSIVGATLWAPPDGWQQSPLDELRQLPALIWAFGRRLGVGKEMSDLMKTHHPTEPHWYLSVIGTQPSIRGGGYGRSLMQSQLDRCDADHAPAYLESSKAENVPYYERFGFEVTGEVVVPGGGPTLWPMWRNPR